MPLFTALYLAHCRLRGWAKLNDASSLAYLEMYLCLAIFFARFDLTLFETDEGSMEWLDHGVASNRFPVKVDVVAQSGESSAA